MFPNKSSSYEISSKINAFVQNNYEEDKSESLRGMAQPPRPTSPTQQVPEKRDVMVVETGVCVEGDPDLTVIAGHPSQAPAKIPSSHNDDCESDGSSKMPLAETRTRGALCLDSIKSYSVNDTISVKDKLITSYRSESSTLLYNIPQPNDDTDQEVESFKICDYYSRWGIPRCFKLKGGGEKSLTTGTTSWGSPPNQSGSTGWNSNSNGSGNNSGGQGGQGSAVQSPAPPSSGQGWGNSQSNANSNSNNNNGSRNSVVNQQGGSGGAQQQAGGGPPSQSTASPAATVSTSTATTASASSSAANTSNNNTTTTSTSQQNGSTGNQQVGGGSSWAAAAGKGLPPTSTTSTPTSTGNTSTKQQMEQLNTMREALYSQDGWGGQNVNQDSNWDIPGSPEPGGKDSNSSAAVPIWKLPINNGTDLWEANLRNGGLPPPASQQSQKPWGHTPSSNIGGTWGEDDEGDASNVWTGVPPQAPAASGPQWPTQPPPIWPGKKDGDWSGPNWNEQRDPRELRHSDMRQMMDARDHIRPTSIDHRSMGSNDLLLRGDPRGITGRLNGVTSEAMWPGPAPHHHLPHHQGKLQTQPNQPGVNQWSSGGGPPMKDMTSLGGKSTGWEEPSPPAQRRNMPNYDDGTSLWGPQHARPTIQGQNKVSHWKEMPAPGIGRGGLQCPPGRTNPSMKPDQPLWPHHPSRNGGGWTETGMDGGPWGDDKPTSSAAPWMDQGLAPSSWQSGPKHKPSWDGSDIDPASWVHSKQPSKTVTKEFIWTSKQFRILSEMGFKKEDIESALRSTGMVLEDALDQLNTARSLGGGGGGDRWPRHSDLDPDHTALMNAFPSPQQAICLTPFPGGGSGAGGPGGPSLATLSPAVMQKLLAQQPPQQQPFATQQSSRTQQTQQPSAQQLKMLVQQIQMAVQGGYLSPQILNQPLAPQTLLLLNQLLQQIKNLQQLMQHHTVMQVNPLGKPSSNHILQLSVQITKTKQQITNLQNQIAAQQAVYVKHQQQTPPTSEFFKNPLHEPISSLHSNFSDLSLKEPQIGEHFMRDSILQTGGTSQQSRLNQWKLPALEKDSDLGSGGEFSRAPGTTAKSAPGSSSPNTNLLLGQADGTWSSVNRESGWPESSGDDSSGKDWPNSSQPPSQAFSDLVPEFEPGKPWKGNPLKSIEDDPSLTPGSVVRSPLSLPSIKDTHILSTSTGGGKASPTTSSSLDIMPSLGLSSSSTWSFTPSSSNNSVKLNSSGTSVGAGSGSSSSNGAGKASASTWESNPSDLWAPKRGPPPGLPAKPSNSSSAGQAANGWGSALTSSRSSWSGSQGWPGPNQPAATQPGSTWLLLRNLTPQIDGSTLKTLCLQHGPLQSFHLYLNHGIALAKYASREEANKAQGALNNCVLGNTTIFAESPGENDVLSLLQHLGQGGGSGGSAWRGKESWGNSQLWGGTGSSGGSLWPGDNDQHRNTPSSMNSFLPGDLLGGESI